MRRVVTLSLASALAAASLLAFAGAAEAQSQSQRRGDRPSNRGQQADGSQQRERDARPRLAPLRGNQAAGPCPYVKILYDAARYVELTGDRVSAQNVGYTGEIEGLSSNCAYQGTDPITVDADILFNFGRGPQAQGDARTYRYWIAVTERNRAVLAKEYVDLPVDFEGQQRASVTDQRTIVIPRLDATIAGSNFEILIGFDVTPQMAEFNATGSRFRVNAGTAPAAQPPAQ
jgi:hypothetical protein